VFEQSTLEINADLIGKELDFLIKQIKRSPKSYTLWYHRQWIIEIGLGTEREQLTDKSQWKSKILEMELQLCNKML
jgi:hypothetical protein